MVKFKGGKGRMKNIEKKLESEHIKTICRWHIYELKRNQKCSNCTPDEFNQNCPDYIPKKIWVYNLKDK